MRFKDKVTLITGATSGIGLATARLFAAEGARVAFTGRRREKGEALVREIETAGGRAHFIAADHMQAADCERSVAETLAHFGQIDVLFNNAGIVVGGTAETTTEEDW
ncbi:MAG: SDR family NAD(P)-dependent oxidoreductase, partial [Anaerolineales bacterium]|nr:SDR family NAD(P)-dependent oxidoreductase [Anaerolineales bacterium]